MKKFALILSGCGQRDGTEIYEGIYTITAMAQADIAFDVFAPDMNQAIVFDHYHQTRMDETRNVLIEAARLVRTGKIKPITQAHIEDYDAVVMPGGKGAVMNLCNFVEKGINFTIQEDLKKFLDQAAEHKKPIGFICIAPIMIPKIFQGAKLTIGNDPALTKMIQEMGSTNIDCLAKDVVIDEKNLVVSTPANMVAKNLLELFEGIQKLINTLDKLSTHAS